MVMWRRTNRARKRKRARLWMTRKRCRTRKRRKWTKIRNTTKPSRFSMACRQRLRNRSRSRICRLRKMWTRRRLALWRKPTNRDISTRSNEDDRTITNRIADKAVISRIGALLRSNRDTLRIEHRRITGRIDGWYADKAVYRHNQIRMHFVFTSFNY